MFEVIMYLFESYMQVEQTVEIDAQDVTNELLAEGFKKEDIKKALAWLDNLAALHEQNPESKTTLAQTTSIRIYSDIEQQRLNSEAQGYLAFLEQAKLLNTHTREIVIDCAMSLDVPELSLQDLKWLVLMVLYNLPDNQDAFLQMESMLLDYEDGLIH